MGAESNDEECRKPGWHRCLDRWLHKVVLLAMAAATAFMAAVFRPPRVELGTDPSFLNVLFSNRLVVWCFWAIAINGAIFLFGSLVARTAAKDWANQAGPIGTPDGEAAQDQKAALDDLGEWPERAMQLKAEIGTLTEVNRRLREDYRAAVEDIAERDEEIRRLTQAREGGAANASN